MEYDYLLVSFKFSNTRTEWGGTALGVTPTAVQAAKPAVEQYGSAWWLFPGMGDLTNHRYPWGIGLGGPLVGRCADEIEVIQREKVQSSNWKTAPEDDNTNVTILREAMYLANEVTNDPEKVVHDLVAGVSANLLDNERFAVNRLIELLKKSDYRPAAGNIGPAAEAVQAEACAKRNANMESLVERLQTLL